jgi:hypothetical protein
VETNIEVHDQFEAATFSQRTVVIPTGTVPTLQFTMHDGEKRTLWDAGHRVATEFSASGPTGVNIFGQTPPAENLPESSGGSGQSTQS